MSYNNFLDSKRVGNIPVTENTKHNKILKSCSNCSSYNSQENKCDNNYWRNSNIKIEKMRCDEWKRRE